ncbi:hypothetical protein CFS9_13950 [Flavobacterium sp. CFS9]|uniref:Uncharacterized protein n=1 Tax=Flavobacterium sp. CFS9 TaxID=3143118 RepID=A0AAT9GZY7_9FLAO
MKKTALKIVLFSTVMIATSFATPQRISPSDSIAKFSTNTIDDQFTGRGKRKQDNINTLHNLNQSEGFRQDRQSVSIVKKMD